MEHALLINRAAQLAHFEPGRFDRIYFGHDLCPRLLPGAAACATVARFAAAHGVGLTLLTPIADSPGLARLTALLRRLAPLPALDEVVVNDWGVLALVRREHPRLGLAVGRALAFTTPVSDVTALVDLGVRRVEQDLAMLVGPLHEPAAPALPLAAYYPYNVISSSRYCPSRGVGRPGGQGPGILPCRRECRALAPLDVHLDPGDRRTAKTPALRPLQLKGNSLFAIQPLPAAGLEELGVTRLIYEPELPL